RSRRVDDVPPMRDRDRRHGPQLLSLRNRAARAGAPGVCAPDASIRIDDGDGRGRPGGAGARRVVLATRAVAVSNAATIRRDWSIPEIESVYTASLPDLLFRAQVAHRAHHTADEVQGCMLPSIKPGGCAE